MLVHICDVLVLDLQDWDVGDEDTVWLFEGWCFVGHDNGLVAWSGDHTT
jgi:hypothetical protein